MSDNNQFFKEPISSNAFTITFVYPNRDEVCAVCEKGCTIKDAAGSIGIDIDAKNKMLCTVQVQGNEIHPPSDEELEKFSPAQIQDGYRYADTYKINADLYVFLKLIRIKYLDNKGDVETILAHEGEGMYELHERTESIDMPFACRGQLSCSTCFCEIITNDSVFNELGEITEDEEDLMCMLSPSPKSRLGCQCKFPLSADNVITIIDRRNKNK